MTFLWGSLIRGSFISFVFELFLRFTFYSSTGYYFLITIVCFMQMNSALKRKIKRNIITEK